MENTSYQYKYYQNNKDKVSLYKKEFYAKKTEPFKNVKNISIIGIAKSLSNSIIKTAITQNRLIITTDNGITNTSDLNDFDFAVPINCLAFLEINGYLTPLNTLSVGSAVGLINEDKYHLHLYISNINKF